MNRLAALHNVQYICPPFATVLINIYRTPARLILLGGGEIESSEGTTQGCTLAMGFYGLGTNLILRRLKTEIPAITRAWLADDATGAGKLDPLKKMVGPCTKRRGEIRLLCKAYQIMAHIKR